MAHDNYGLLVDIGNFLCADEEPAHAVSRVAPYAVYVHAKDFLRSSQKPEGEGWFQTRGCNYLKGTVVGEGYVPLKQCMQILKRAGYDGYVSIEFEGREDCINAIARGKANLEAVLATL